MMKKILAGIAIITIVLAACTKTNSPGEAPRLFRPVIKDQLESNGNWIKASWQVIKGAVAYKLEVSRDTFNTVESFVTADTNVVTIQNLYWDRLYQVRVKAIAADTSHNSGYSNLGAIKTARFPSILNIPTLSEINDNSVKVTWVNSGDIVTSIKILKASDSSVVTTVALNGTDVTNRYKIVSGLNQTTSYIIYLYSGTTVRGWADFTTKASFSGALIDLRGITGQASILMDTIPDIASGSVIILKRGETYNISSTLSLNKSLTFIGGTDLLVPAQPLISMPSNFNITSGSTIDSIVFIDVILRGTDYASKYIFNINTACNVGKIRFDNCVMEIFRGITRTQSQPVILGSFVMNNCIVDSVKDYGVINADVASSKVDNISITNSTFSRCDKIVVSSKPTAGSLSVLIDNCTFNEAPLGNGSNYIVDYGSFNVTNGITINNSIFGIGKTSSGARNVRDVRAGAGTTINASNNYRTSDHVSLGNDLPSIVTYSRPSVEIWQDPYNKNFKIIDNTFPGRNTTGDPRWRP